MFIREVGRQSKTQLGAIWSLVCGAGEPRCDVEEKAVRDDPGILVAKSLLSQCRGPRVQSPKQGLRFDPGQEARSHTAQLKIPHAAMKILSATTKTPVANK